MSLSRSSQSGSSEIDLMLLLVPMINLCNNHFSGCDRYALVSISVNDINVFVAIGREDHSELTTVLSKDRCLIQLHPTLRLGHDERITALKIGDVTNGDNGIVLMPVKTIY